MRHRGFTASDHGLTERRGLLAVLSEDSDAAPLSTPFGEPRHVEDVLFKFHAACYLTHATIDAALDLRQRVTVPEIEEIELTVPPGHLGVCAIPEPRTGLEGKFSLRFTAALALHTGATDESRFTDDAARDPALVALRDRVTVRTDDDVPHFAGPPRRPYPGRPDAPRGRATSARPAGPLPRVRCCAEVLRARRPGPRRGRHRASQRAAGRPADAHGRRRPDPRRHPRRGMTTTEARLWPKGRFFEEFAIGDVLPHHWGRTLMEADNTTLCSLP